MKRNAKQPGIVPALTLVADVEDGFLFRRAGRILKRPDAAFAFPDAQFIRAGNGRKADTVGENKIGERDDRRPVARNAGRDFGHHAVEKSPDGRAAGEAVRFLDNNWFGTSGQKDAARQSEGQNPLAVLAKRLDHNWNTASFADAEPSSNFFKRPV